MRRPGRARTGIFDAKPYDLSRVPAGLAAPEAEVSTGPSPPTDQMDQPHCDPDEPERLTCAASGLPAAPRQAVRLSDPAQPPSGLAPDRRWSCHLDQICQSWIQNRIEESARSYRQTGGVPNQNPQVNGSCDTSMQISPCYRCLPVAISAPFRDVAPQAANRRRCRSSVVEHSLGKGEVESSILSGSTIPTP